MLLEVFLQNQELRLSDLDLKNKKIFENETKKRVKFTEKTFPNYIGASIKMSSICKTVGFRTAEVREGE